MIFWGSVPTRFRDALQNCQALVADLERNLRVNEDLLSHEETKVLREVLHTLGVVTENLQRQGTTFKQVTESANQRKRQEEADKIADPGTGKWTGIGWSTKK